MRFINAIKTAVTAVADFINAVGKALADKLLATINAVVTPLAAGFPSAICAILLGVAIVGTANSTSHLPDCKANPGCLMELGDKWWSITLADMQTMINAGADVKARGDINYTPLHEAASKGDAKLISILIQYGADVNAKNSNNLTPLHKAATRGNAKIVLILVKAGAYIDAGSRGGYTPLHTAARWGQAQVIPVLINLGAYINATNNYGRTPLDVAKYTRNWEAAKELEKHGAK